MLEMKYPRRDFVEFQTAMHAAQAKQSLYLSFTIYY